MKINLKTFLKTSFLHLIKPFYMHTTSHGSSLVMLRASKAAVRVCLKASLTQE
jgi:hypothetical protein